MTLLIRSLAITLSQLLRPPTAHQHPAFHPRSSVEVFWERVVRTPKRDDVPPIITTAKYYMVNAYRGGMYVLATLTGEVRARARGGGDGNGEGDGLAAFGTGIARWGARVWR